MTDTNTDAASARRQLVRFSSWNNGTKVYTARQWDNGDLELEVADHTSGERQFYNDEISAETVECILDVEDVPAWEASLS